MTNPFEPNLGASQGQLEELHKFAEANREVYPTPESEPVKSLLEVAKDMAGDSWKKLGETVKKIKPEFAVASLSSGLATFYFLRLLNLHFNDLGSITEGGNNLVEGAWIYGNYLANFTENFTANPQLYSAELTPFMGIAIFGFFTSAWGSGIIAPPTNAINHEANEVVA